jgi:hypothetical protein
VRPFQELVSSSASAASIALMAVPFCSDSA